MICSFFSIGMLLKGEMTNGDYDDGVVAAALLGLQDEENQ